MLRGVVYRLIEYLASMGRSSIWKLIWAISVSRKLTVGVHLSSTPSISGPGSATVLSIYICKNGLDPDQTRMEFKTECFLNLKICACDRKYAKCRTKADAHDKMVSSISQ